MKGCHKWLTQRRTAICGILRFFDSWHLPVAPVDERSPALPNRDFLAPGSIALGAGALTACPGAKYFLSFRDDRITV
ncbi:MAG TPA: hypothetical protein VGD78_09520 [Chthoniobacterales bacterium]